MSTFDFDVVPQGTQITDCCRICLSDTELMDMKSSDFINNERGLSYYQLFRECSGLQTNEIFILPSGKGQNAFKICKLCVVQLESCYTFRDLCRQANTILTDRYLMQAQNEIDEEGPKTGGHFLSGGGGGGGSYTAYTGPIHRNPIDGRFPCPKCDKTFKYLSLLNQHQAIHGPPKVRKFRCQICMASYKHQLSLQSHLRTAHNIFDPNMPVERRGRKPVTYNRPPMMRPVQPMEQPSMTGTDENGLLMDIKAEPMDEMANGDGQTYNCMDCDQTFHDSVEYNQHMAVHKQEQRDEEEANDGGDESGGANMGGGESSSTPDGLKNKCNQCSAGPFRTPSGLYHHMQTTHNLLRFKCTYCLKQFTRKQTLQDHNCKVKQMAQHPIMTAVHNASLMAQAQGNGLLNCPYCDYETDMRENFQEHLDEVHSHNFNYNGGQTEQSGYEDNSMMNPEVQMNDESGEQNEDDAMQMFCYENMLTPQVTMETDFNNSADNSAASASTSVADPVPPPLIVKGADGKKQYQCPECSRQFQYLSYYKQHMISHSTVKNFKCTYCPSTYKHEKSLIEHIAKHQAGKQLKVPVRAFASVNPVAVAAAAAAAAHTSGIKSESKVARPPPPYGFTPIKIEAPASLSESSTGKPGDDESDAEASNDNEASGAGENETSGFGDNETADDSFAQQENLVIQKDPRTGRFYCKICDRHYQYLSNYKQHMVKHSDVKKYKCNLCPMTYKTEKSYIGHMKGHEEGLIPAKPMSMDPLVPQMPQPPPHQQLQQKMQQQKHQQMQPIQSTSIVPKKEKTDENFYKCKQCDKTLQSQGGLYHHVQTVHKHFRFFCKLCHQTFTTKKSLQRHMFTHKERAFMYNCTEPGCNFFTNIRQRLAVHLINTHNLKYKEELHGCLRDMGDTRLQIAPADDFVPDDADGDQNNGTGTSYSPYADEDDNDMAMNYGEGDEDGEPYEGGDDDNEQPDDDGEQGDDQNSADDGEIHTMTIAPDVILEAMDSDPDNDGSQHDPLDANPSTSTGIRRDDEDDCMIVADDEVDMLAVPPMRKRPRGDLICPQCNQCYYNQQELMQHIALAHVNMVAPVKRYKCRSCPAAFTMEKNLEFHMKTHKTPGREPHGDPENMVQCPQCDKTLYSKSGLYHHIKSRHEGVKYACKLCEKEFTTKDMLWQHSFHHREDCPWPFICKEPNCEFRTKGKSLYQTHLKTVHGVKYDDQIHGYHDLSFQEIIDSVLDRTKFKKKKIKMT